MYGLTRATLTLIGVALAGVLLWLATAILPSTVSDASRGEYWAAFGLVALAGLAMALSQLLGGWTKWGWPRVSGNVFLLAFLPTLIAGGWILAGHEPESYWLGRHVRRLVERHRGRRLRRLDGPDDPGRRVRNRPRVRAHVRHDRPATRGDEAGARSRCAATGITEWQRER